MVNNLRHTDSNTFQGQGGVSCAGDCSVSRLPHEDQDKEDPSRLIDCCAFLKTQTQKSAGHEIAGLELKFWSSSMDTGEVKG